jgi:DNA-binding CsgD family transcriptional regulator
MARALEDEHLLSMALGAQMVAHGLAGDLPPVIVMSTERAALLRRAGRAAELGMVLNNLAWLLVASGDAAAAHAAICESLALYDEQADRTQPLHLRFANDSGMNLLHTAAVVAMVRGDDDTAREYFTAVLTAPFHDHDTIVGAVEGLAIIAARHGEHERALRLLSGATTANHKIDPFWAGQLAAATGAAEEAVGPAVASAAAAQGSALTVEQLIKQALHGPQAADENLRGGLTPREYQVAQLVARGLTNAQIAAALSMSERTVVSHLRNVRAKVGLGTRVEIAMWFTARQA